MSFGKILRWFLFACFFGFVSFIAWVVVRPRPKPVEGWERPAWLPAAASDVHYQSQEGFGWWRVAQFTITEKDLRAYAAGQGWKLQERLDYRPVWMRSLYSVKTSPQRNLEGEGNSESATGFIAIPRALVSENIQTNGGGIRLAFDQATSRAYYSESHR
jgi:hypothetical protein